MGAPGKRLGSLTLRNEYEVYLSAEAPGLYIVRQRSKSLSGREASWPSKERRVPSKSGT